MKVLVLYATIEGQTEKIARFVSEQLESMGHTAVVENSDDMGALSFDDVDAAILAASVHQRRHPRSFEALLSGFKDELDALPTLLLSVSLNAAFPEGQEEAADYVTEMEMRTKFTPKDMALVAGAVRTTEYDYFAMQVIRHVVLRDREYTGPGEHEFTDWQALATRLSDFMASAG